MNPVGERGSKFITQNLKLIRAQKVRLTVNLYASRGACA